MQPPSPLSAGGRVEPPTKFSKRGGMGLTKISIFRGGLWGKWGGGVGVCVAFSGCGGGRGGSFYIKNKLKSKIFNYKKSL